MAVEAWEATNWADTSADSAWFRFSHEKVGQNPASSRWWKDTKAYYVVMERAGGRGNGGKNIIPIVYVFFCKLLSSLWLFYPFIHLLFDWYVRRYEHVWTGSLVTPGLRFCGLVHVSSSSNFSVARCCSSSCLWGFPKMDSLQGKIPLKWMIWGYPYFRKPPYHWKLQGVARSSTRWPPPLMNRSLWLVYDT